MKASSLFAASLAVALLSQTATPSFGATASLPGVVVEAPKQIVRPEKPKPRAVARSTVSSETSPTTSTRSASPTSPAERELAKLPNAITGSCVGGCQTSFRSGDRPWVGCSWSAGTLSSTCRNEGHYKTYNECTTAALAIGWRGMEVSWYCSSLALK
jgi:hypothetical protein